MRQSKMVMTIKDTRIKVRDFKDLVRRSETLSDEAYTSFYKGLNSVAALYTNGARRVLKAEAVKALRNANKKELAYSLHDEEGRAPSAPKRRVAWELI